ncbi:MAG: hypothetical protein RBR09_13525 [Desulfobulbaceae bacterium]|jgi:hypothetical protein|nr:hypothetical protein [Deltaproteobacteria bacterium]MDY0352269.1 hypothetical protein [Desulfobulbaceae bacterium]
MPGKSAVKRNSEVVLLNQKRIAVGGPAGKFQATVFSDVPLPAFRSRTGTGTDKITRDPEAQNKDWMGAVSTAERRGKRARLFPKVKVWSPGEKHPFLPLGGRQFADASRQD